MPSDKLVHVKRVLHGWNQGRPVAPIHLPEAATTAAAEGAYDLQAYRFEAAPEQLRAPRVVRVGLVQNACPAPTTAPFAEQRQVRNACQCDCRCHAAVRVGAVGGDPCPARPAAAAPRKTTVACLASAAPAGRCTRAQLGCSPPAHAQAIHDRVQQIIDAAGAVGVQVGCVPGWMATCRVARCTSLPAAVWKDLAAAC